MMRTLKPPELIHLKLINKYRGKSNQVDTVYFSFQKHSKRLFTRLNYNGDEM